MAEPSRREAQKAYENKDHSTALAILERVLASSPPQDELIAILDLRVSVYLKLGDKVSARKDATCMIRTNRADGRGYLRLGQLERLSDGHAAAITWYEHGLKEVPESDRPYAYILAQHTKTMALLKGQAVLSRPVDPFMKLPAEMIEMIVSFFSYREAVLCLRVSKTWRQMLSTYSPLRNTLDFSHVGKGRLVSFAAIKAALQRSQKAERPVLVVAKNFTKPAARQLRETMDRWIHYTKMQHLEVHYPSRWDQPPDVDFQYLQWHRFQLRTLVFGSEQTVFLGTVYKILQSCGALQKAIFLSVQPGPMGPSADSWVQSTAVSKPNLTTLTLQGHRMNVTPPYFNIPVCGCLFYN